MGNNAALVTMLNEEFVIGFKALLESIMRHNIWFDLPIVVLDIDLKEETKENLIKRYPRILFEKIKENNYLGTNFAVTAPKLRCTYYKLDAFLLTGYDKIIFIDSDCLVLGDISPLFNCNSGFAAIKGYDANRDVLRRDFNSGVFVVSRQYLNENTYLKLVHIAKAGFKMPDQTTLNLFFKGRTEFLDKVYNVEKRMLYTKNFSNVFSNAKIIHYVAEKPWQKKTNAIEEQFATIERKWFEYYHE